MVNLLLGSYDSKETKSYLYWIDYLGSHTGYAQCRTELTGTTFPLILSWSCSIVTIAQAWLCLKGVELLERCVRKIYECSVVFVWTGSKEEAVASVSEPAMEIAA